MHTHTRTRTHMHTVPKYCNPNMERLAQMCGGEELKAELWEELGKSLGISSERLEKIALEEKDNLEKCKQCVLNVSCVLDISKL